MADYNKTFKSIRDKAPAKNRKRSDGTLAYRTLQFYIHMLQAGTMVALGDFDQTWGSPRRFLDIRNLLQQVFEHEAGYPLLEYFDEEGRPTSGNRRHFVRLAMHALKPPHPRNFTVFPLLAELLSPFVNTTVSDQFNAIYELNMSGLTHSERQAFQRLKQKFHSVSTINPAESLCPEVLDEVFEALTREQELTLWINAKDTEANVEKRVWPVGLGMADGEFLLVYITGDQSEPKVIPLGGIVRAKWNRRAHFPCPPGVDSRAAVLRYRKNTGTGV